MALGATVYRANVDISDTDRHYYAEHRLTLARHPSETEARMMVRLLAFCLRAHEDLEFTRGLSTVDEPEVWRKDPTGRVLEWIDVGQPAFERLKKARGRSERVFVYSFGRGREQWLQTEAEKIATLPAVTLVHLQEDEVEVLAQLAAKNMSLSVCISDGVVYITSGEDTISVHVN